MEIPHTGKLRVKMEKRQGDPRDRKDAWGEDSKQSFLSFNYYAELGIKGSKDVVCCFLSIRGKENNM